MPIVKNFAFFFKATYKVFAVFVFAVVFFSFYKAYLVDHSFINLKIALDKALPEAKTLQDFEKIKSLLKVPILKEVVKAGTSGRELLYLEMAENIADSATSLDQAEDIRFCLKSIISAEEKKRNNFVSALDNFNSNFFGPEINLSGKELEAKKSSLLAKISRVSNKGELQKLYYELGNVYLQLSDLSKAESAFNQALEAGPNTKLALKIKFNLGWTHKYSGDYVKAIADFEQLSQEHQENEISLNSQYQVADSWFKKGDFLQGRDKYAQLAEKYPDSSDADLALFQAGYISYYKLHDRDAALKYFAKLEEKFPKNNISKYAKSVTADVMVVDLRDDGYALLADKKYLEATINFKKAEEAASSDSRSIVGEGLALYWLGDKVQAAEKAIKAAEIPSDDEVTVVNALFILINCSKIDEAIKIGEDALNKKIMKRTEFYYNLGYAYVIKADIEKAYTQFAYSIKLDPDFIYAYNNLGCSFWSTEKYSDAISKFKEAVARGTNYPDAHFNLGVAYFHLNQLEEAYKEFKITLELKNDYPEAKNYLDRIEKILHYKP